MKYHLIHTTKDQILNKELYSTLIHRIKTILNLRPLCYKVQWPCFGNVHFGSLCDWWSTDFSSWTRDRAYKFDQALQIYTASNKSFCHLWSKDYLSNKLKTRSKWHQSSPNVKISQVVILRDDLVKLAK